jgi:hypothetical protein
MPWWDQEAADWNAAHPEGPFKTGDQVRTDALIKQELGETRQGPDGEYTVLKHPGTIFSSRIWLK